MTESGSQLEWRNLALWRGDRCLHADLNGSLLPGQALTLRGPNGCGKTTLLRTLCGLSEPEEGQVLWGGEPIHRQRGVFNAQLAYAGHLTGLKADLSVRENLRFAAELEDGAADASKLIADLKLSDCADLPARNLSAGQRRRAALARVLGSGKALWVMDEPFSNVDDTGREWLGRQFAAHLERGGLLLMAAHQSTGLPDAREQVLHLGATPR